MDPNRAGRVKLCDFGLARKKPKDITQLTLCGTDEYMAPELMMVLPLPTFPLLIFLQGDIFNDKCDVFSYGLVLSEIMMRRKPLKRKPQDFFEYNL